MKVTFIQVLEKRFGKLLGYASLLLILLMGISIARNIGRVFAIRKEVEKQRERVVKIEAENKRIEEEITKAQKPEFIERQVRDKLGLVKEGETVVVVPDEETLKKLAPQIDSQEDYLPDPTWRKWLKLFL